MSRQIAVASLSEHRGHDRNEAARTPDFLPLITPGEYSVSFVGHRTANPFGKMKVALRFRIQTPGEFYGIELERWYNAQRLIGKVGKGGHFKPPSRGDFVIEYLRLFPHVDLRRLDRIPLQPFRQCLIKATVETVTTNSTQDDMPDQLHYSVIRKLLETGV